MATPSDSSNHNSSPDSSRPTNSPPPPPTPTLTHPALTVPNISNFIKITLSIEKSTYNTWSELFKIHARVFQVIDHIIPSEPAANPSLKTTDPQLWLRLDSVVLQWIYGTISDDLLNTIIEHNSTAETAWNRLFDIFYDNKNSRALYLEQELSRTHMEQFFDASSYCQHLKSLSDQLANVGASVSEDRLVLQLISGLTDAYAAVGSQIRHATSLPKFYKARSMIILEETALQKKATSPAENSSFIASQNDASADSSSSRPNRGNNNSGRGRSYGRGQRGRSRGRNHGRGGAVELPVMAAMGYTTMSVSDTPTSSYAPTDIQAAMHTLSLSPPDDQWYMDTGATSHMTENGGTLLMRCNSSGDLYLVATRPPTTALPSSTFAALSTELWHNRLGHPGATILSSLHRDNFLQYNKSRNNFFLTSGLPQF
ncbi:hypothetical protein TSUD_224090 [Trifolium subterraneum]|uniref:GAG-pre-integrase domain-containing protein n=1 Tax=Trifolium subterraneum TaxID=3900 RepID=A0A2Z6MLN2_TRISU|nr:hypothetical protein TSUD_224090 [Trifolium subterraneum]